MFIVDFEMIWHKMIIVEDDVSSTQQSCKFCYIYSSDGCLYLAYKFDVHGRTLKDLARMMKDVSYARIM